MTSRWTGGDVAALLDEAVDTLLRMPGEGPAQVRSCMPAPLREEAEVFANAVSAGRYEEMVVRRGPASAAAVSRLDMVLGWMAWLADTEVTLVWAVAMGVKFSALARRRGVSRQAEHQRWMGVILKLTRRLNAEKVPVRKIAA